MGPLPMATRAGENFFLAKLSHLDSFPVNFDQKISKKSNFQNWSILGPILTTFGTPTGPLGVQIFF